MENENSSSSDKEDNKEKKQKGFKGFMNKLRGSPRGSHDSTADNGITNSPEKTEKVDDEKLTIEVDQISVNDEISQGHFSSLYHAEWRSNYATMIKPKDDNPLTIKNIEYQARIVMKTRNHKNLWTLLGVTKKPPGILMESIEGFLDDKVHANKLDAKTITSFALEIANGMSHLHSEGIIHCDLACKSVIAEKFEDKYVLKIGGFDLCCFENDTDKITELQRTQNWPFRWTAPEVLQHNKVSRASDVWSFGVLLWEMCERKLPYEGQSESQVVEGVCKQGMRLGTGTAPSGLVSLMQKCWSFEPENRPSFPEIVVTLQTLLKEYNKK